MAIGEIFLAAFIKVLFEKLASGELLNFARREGIHTLLAKWSRSLEEIEAVLADAEEKQITDQRGIKVWLEDLEDLAYDLDDIVDEFATEDLRQKLKGSESRAGTSKVLALIPACCTSFTPRSLLSDFRMKSKIRDITARLQDIFERRSGLGLQKVTTTGTFANKALQRPPTTSLMHEPCVYGRVEDKKEIIELLLNDESSNSKVGVIPILGMGGVGKTTLAQIVYNDEKVERHFDTKAWICVSEEFDIMEVTKAILESVTSQPCDFKALDQVQVQLKQALAGKKFLIVLDDVWNKRHSDWSSLKSPFNDGAQGSKVLVTTRNTDVALMMATVKCHYLKQLSEDDCWLVFAHHAFENMSIDASPNLVSIGKKIVEKCGGLPLAARTLGGLLRCRLRDDEWEDVLNSKMWELSNEESDILPALRLSYHHLPSQLKKCFAYCSILPKDYEFEEEELVLLWIAEGFIQKPQGKKQMEDLGREYFRELLSMSFFLPSSSGATSLFVMHDLVNDLAQFVAREICFRLEDKLKGNEQYKNISKARHSSYIRGHFDSIKKFEAFYEAKHLRTFLPCGFRDDNISYLTSNVPLHLLPKLRCLRVLRLSRYHIGELPNSIGDLRHVRYLDLSYTMFSTLPESLGTLYNLQTLILRYCSSLKKLPKDLGNLINLRHLDVTGANSLQEMPPKIGKLTSLQTLSNFIVGKGNGFMIGELGNLIHLRGTLCLSGLENVVNALDARGASLNDKEGLDELLMEWNNSSDNSQNERVELEVLDMLQPHKKLKELTISGYHGPIFPNWVVDPLFSNMVCLTIQYCGKCTGLPPLGQLPSLAKLYIRGMAAVKNVGLEFYGQGCLNPFPSLETLHFGNMPEWEDWSPSGVDEDVQAFGRLSELSIRRCPKLLGKLPSNLPCLRKLEVKECPQLMVVWVPHPTMLHHMTNTLHFNPLINSLTSLSLSDVSILGFFPIPEVAEEVVIASAACNHLSSLTSTSVENIQKLTCLPRWFFQGLTGLQKLMISNCKELATLWQNEVRLQQSLPALLRLVIEDCPQLISLFEEEEEKERQKQDDWLPCMVRLEYLRIEKCRKLEKLPRGLHTLTFLGELKIYNCPSLVSFPETGLPPTLTTLEIIACHALRCLPDLMMHDNLEHLRLAYCQSLKCLSSRGLPPRLKQLKVYRCVKLESLLAEEGMKMNCPSLECIGILYSGNLISLPDVMQKKGLRNLSRLEIRECNNLGSLPKGWFPFTTNMRELDISSCPAGSGIASYLLKEGSTLKNLTSLTIGNIDIAKPPSELGLHKLSSLRKLCLEDYCWVSFPEDGMLLPTSLIDLTIKNFPNLEDFRNLTSLEGLEIVNCPKFASFPKEGLPPLLSHLWINECPNLATFPEQGLPPSLLYLSIYGCPLLSQRCEKGKGKYWPFIAHIPRVEI